MRQLHPPIYSWDNPAPATIEALFTTPKLRINTIDPEKPTPEKPDKPAE
jgi:hypothetical protein